jgi:hypothetical protein
MWEQKQLKKCYALETFERATTSRCVAIGSALIPRPRNFFHPFPAALLHLTVQISNNEM